MQFPGPVRAVVGLLANAADEAKHLPERAMELPMLAVSTALQASLRAQQRYARLAARGDEVLSRRPATDDPPAWATFDDPLPIDEARTGPVGAERGQATSDLLDELLRLGDQPGAQDVPNGSTPATTATPAAEAPAAEAPAAEAPAARKAPVAKKPPPAKKAPAAKKPPAAKKAPGAQGAAAPEAPATDKSKTVRKPRHTAPSRFDAVDDE